MVLDTSAIVALLRSEDEGVAFVDLLIAADDPVISAATLVELSMVMLASFGEEGISDLDEFLSAAGVRTVAVDEGQAHLAREAFARYGKRRDPAGLNFGDCFSYALAKATGRPLLFKGADFARTDIAAVGPPV